MLNIRGRIRKSFLNSGAKPPIDSGEKDPAFKTQAYFASSFFLRREGCTHHATPIPIR